jgi:hypothetical protein
MDIIPFEKFIPSSVVNRFHKANYVFGVCDHPCVARLGQQVRAVACGAGDWAGHCANYAAKILGFVRGTHGTRARPRLNNDSGTRDSGNYARTVDEPLPSW